MITSQVTVSAIEAFNDNYIWLLSAPQSDLVTLVDPGDAEVCIAYLTKQQKQLNRILITHYHFDHVGGINQLKAYCAEKNWPLTIYGPAFSELANAKELPIPKKHFRELDQLLKQDDIITLPEFNLDLKILALPGHTLEHIAYYGNNLLFCGDTLFAGGCGRIFEGSARQMLSSLKSLAALPNDTKVYCAHEYTLNNLQFALQAEPDNQTLLAYFNKAKALRAKNASTLPTNIGQEKQINPFLRCHLPTLQTTIKQLEIYQDQNDNDELSTFSALRQWKNSN